MAKVGYTDTVYGNAENINNLAEENLTASADAIVVGANTGLGMDVVTSEQISLQQDIARQNLQQIKENNMSTFDHTVRGVTKTTFAILSYPFDVLSNVINNTIGIATDEVMEGKRFSELTEEEKQKEIQRRSDIFWNGTQLGQIVGSTANYIAGNSKELDTGSDWWLPEDSVAFQNILQAQRNIAGWDTKNEYGDRATIGNTIAHQALGLERGSVAGTTVSTISDIGLIAFDLVLGGKAFNALSRGVDTTTGLVKGARKEYQAASQAAAATGAARAAEKEINTVTAMQQLNNVKANIAKRFGQEIVDDLDDMADEAVKAVRGTDKEVDTVWEELERYGNFLEEVRTAEGAKIRSTALEESVSIHTAKEVDTVNRIDEVIDVNERAKLSSEMGFYSKERQKAEAIKANNEVIKRIDVKIQELESFKTADNVDGNALDETAVEANRLIDEQINNLNNTKNKYLQNQEIIRSAQIGDEPSADTLKSLADEITGTIVDERILPVNTVENAVKAAETNFVKWEGARKAAQSELRLAKKELTAAKKTKNVKGISQLEKRINDATRKLNTAKSNVSKYKALVKTSQENIVKWEGARKAAQTQFRLANKELDAAKKTNNFKKVKAAEEKVARATRKLNTAKSNVSKYKALVKTSQENIVKSEGARKAAQSELRLANKELPIVSKTSNPKAVKAAEEKIARATRKLDNASARVSKYKTLVKTQKQKLDNRIKNNERLTSARAARESTVKEARLYSDLETWQQMNLAAKESMQAEAILKAEAIKSKYGIDTAKEITTYDEAIEFLRDVQGLRLGANGEEALNIEATLNWATRGGIKHIVEAIRKINAVNPEQAAARIFNLTRGKFDIETVRRLASTDDDKQIMAILMEAMVGSKTGFDIGKLSLLKRGARVYTKNGELIPFENLKKASSSIGEGFDRLVIWGYERKMTNTPWSYSFDTRDASSMVNALNDMIEFTTGTFGIPVGFARQMKIAKNFVAEKYLGLKPTFTGVEGAAWRSFKNKYVSQMINAKTANERKLIWEEAQLEMAKLSGENAGLHLIKTGQTRKLSNGEEVAETQLDIFVNAFKRSRAARNEMIVRMARLHVESKVKNVKGALEETGLVDEIPDSAILYGEFLNFTVGMINPYEMRKMLNTAKTIDELYNTKGLTVTINGVERQLSVGQVRKAIFRLTTDMYDRFFRRAMLFRLGYVVRNVVETQIRMYLEGHPNTLTNPALWFSLSGVRKPNNEALGIIARSLDNAQLDARGLPFVDELAEDGIVRAEFEMTELQKLHNRGSMIDTGAWYDPDRAVKLGYEYATPASRGDYAEGIATHLYRMASNEMNRDVLSALQNKPLREEIWSWAKNNGLDKDNTYEMIVAEYYWSGPGNAKIVELMQANKGKYSGLFDSKDKVFAYLFGNSNISVKQMWNAFTDNFDSKIVDEILSGNLVSGTYRANIKTLKELTKDIVDKAVKNPNTAPIQKVPVAKYVGKNGEDIYNEPLTIGDIFELASNNMFKFSGWGEKTFATLPEFRYAYWDYFATAVLTLSKEDAAKVLATAEKTLSKTTSSWARDTLKTLRANAKNANDTSVIKIDDIHNTANNIAARKVGDLFYDANKRNAVGHALRFISPFGQAWANSMIVWGKLAAQNIGQVYRAEMFLKSLESEGSSWIYDILNQDDADRPFIYKDPATGKKVFGIPLVGELGGLLASAATGVNNPANLTQAYGATIDVGSLNLIMQNGFAPGFGPIIQISDNVMSGNEIYRRLMPDEIRSMVNPYAKDPQTAFNPLGSVTPAWFQELTAQFLFPEKRDKYTTGAMLTLLQSNPEVYLDDNGILDSAGQQRLAQDAIAVSNGLSIARGLTQFFAPGSTKIEAKFEDKDGRYLLASTVSNEFFEYMRQGYDQKEAMSLLVDKYGAQASLTMITANRLGYTPTDDAWELYKDNPELFNEYSTVIPLLYPGGGYSTQLAAYSSTGDKRLDINEKAVQVNRLLRSAQEAELDVKLVKGLIDPYTYEEELNKISESYTGAPMPQVSTSYRASIIDDLTDAMEDPNLASTPAGEALKIYMDNRNYVVDLGVGLDAKKQAGNRQQLFELGTQLAAENPEFSVVWFKVLRSEVKPKEVR